MKVYSSVIRLAKETVKEWDNDRGQSLGAALAFYSALSVYPLFVLVLILTGFFLGKANAMSNLKESMQNLIGPDGVQIIKIVLSHSGQKHMGLIASCMNIAVLIFGASGMFTELQDSFNSIWGIKAVRHTSFWKLVTERLLSFAMVLGTGCLLLVTLVLSLILNFLSQHFIEVFSGFRILFIAINFLASFGVMVGLFSVLFKILPDVKVPWKTVWKGAVLTAVLFDIGKFLIALYLNHASILTTYGAAGSFLAFLIWIYYSAQILYLGVEFTKVLSRS